MPIFPAGQVQIRKHLTIETSNILFSRTIYTKDIKHVCKNPFRRGLLTFSDSKKSKVLSAVKNNSCLFCQMQFVSKEY